MEKEMATQPSILAWKSQGQRSLALQSMGLQRVRHDLATKQQQQHLNKTREEKSQAASSRSHH